MAGAFAASYCHLQGASPGYPSTEACSGPQLESVASGSCVAVEPQRLEPQKPFDVSFEGGSVVERRLVDVVVVIVGAVVVAAGVVAFEGEDAVVEGASVVVAVVAVAASFLALFVGVVEGFHPSVLEANCLGSSWDHQDRQSPPY